MFRIISIFFICIGLFAGCSSNSSDSDSPAAESTAPAELKSTVLQNQAAYIPPQCYTMTLQAEETDPRVHNTCYTCHTNGFRPDFINDDDLQLEYAFPAYAEENRWKNLFKDRSAEIAAIGDEQMTTYIRTSNYLDENGDIIPAAVLSTVPAEWDYDADGVWSGYVPDGYFQFDAAGFDRNPSGAYTGWRAFAYYPFPTVHWPANGSPGDVLIRLPEIFRTMDGVFDVDTYALNLSILESLIKARDIVIPETDEVRYGVDLNRNGALDTATQVTYDWAPTKGRQMEYVGDGLTALQTGAVHLAAGLYPEGTEFLKTVRYVDTTEDGEVRLSPRLKEVRYARKSIWRTYAELETLALDEVKERDDFPDRLKLPIGNIEDGVSNGKGWVLQGFIEDRFGDLRPQTFEETVYCIGCHGGVGATTDDMFSFPRKLDASAHQGGWFHWSQKSLKDINEPKVEMKNAGVQYEYAFYLMYAGAGDDLRANEEVEAKFLDQNGYLQSGMAERLHEDISLLLYPSPERAMRLNKAYKLIVDEQGYSLGREPLANPADQVHDAVSAEDLDTGVSEPVVLYNYPEDFFYPNSIDPAGQKAGADIRTRLDGNGMAGPDGIRYEINREGMIEESDYALDTPGFYFPFPKRHTLPTRMIVPLSNIPACYECHRLDTAMPPENPQVTVPVNIPVTEMTEPGLDLVRLTEDGGTDHHGVWSPNGDRIAFVSDRSGIFQVWIMNADGTDPRQVTRGSMIHGWPRWSPDGSRLVYWGYDPAADTSVVIVDSMDGADPIVLAQSDELLDRPAWRPDGLHIAYAGQTEGNWDVWVAAVDGSESYRLTSDDQMETNPLWSPDGSVIAYKVAPNKAYNLTVEQFMTFENGFESPTVHEWNSIKSIQMNDWSPDGSRIAYTAEIVTNTSGEDRVTYLAAAQTVRLTDTGLATGMPIVLSKGSTLGDRGPVFSPDGSKIAFWAWDTAYRATLWTAAADGSNLKQLTARGYDMYPQWSPDGTSLLFESHRGGNSDLWMVSVAE